MTVLLRSSEDSWTTTSTNIIPDSQRYGDLGFPREGSPSSQVLGVVVEGEFSSFFKGKESPLMAPDKKEEAPKAAGEEEKKEPEKQTIAGIIERSPASARLIVISSGEFLNDQTLSISGATSNRFLNSLQLVENSLEWSLEDDGLLSIRSRGQFARTLESLNNEQKAFWEYLNYALALLGLFAVYGVYQIWRRARLEKFKSMIEANS